MIVPVPMESPSPRIYRDWEIWKWTGWKGNKVIARHDSGECWKCSKPIREWDAIFQEYTTAICHWTCVYPDNRPARLVGHWLAIKGRDITKRRHAAVMVGGPIEADCEYKPGQMFNIGEEALVTELTPESERARFIEEGLTRMFALIDRLESRTE